jgi:hypothetical protein
MRSFFGLLVCVLIQSPLVLFSQAIDVMPFKQREQLVANAQKVISDRGSEPEIPEILPNPFVEKPLPESDVDLPSASAGQVLPEGPNPAESLIKAATKIAATGTASLGGQFFLLAGQKKYKVGDKLSVDCDGLPYELVIISISPTSFTVKKGDLTHTRAIRLQTNLSTPATRP